MFENGEVPQVGQLEVSIEKGLIKELNRRVTADMGNVMVASCCMLRLLRGMAKRC